MPTISDCHSSIKISGFPTMIGRLDLGFPALFLSILVSAATAQAKCLGSCGLALASYYMWKGSNLSFVNEMLQSSVMPLGDLDPILRYNKQISDKDNVTEGTTILVPFPCNCLPGGFPGHVFRFYQVVRSDSYWKIASTYFSNLTTYDSIQSSDWDPAVGIPVNAFVNVTVNCSCGDPSISKKYGLFINYPLRSGKSLNSIALSFGVQPDLIQRYNPDADFISARGMIYIPARDDKGVFPPFKSRKSEPGAPVIAGICVGSAVVIFLAALAIYRFQPWKRLKKSLDPVEDSQAAKGHALSAPPPDLTKAIANKSIEFSYEELAEATDNFNTSFKIGEGGFGAVYYAELREKKAAIKKMEMRASKQFLAELKVLTSVHHVNLVRLIGYCMEGSLFLVYEYIENGNLGQHLRSSGRDSTLPWSKRVQIALDSARGLEYLHERTVPSYIHRDVKSANILIDKNYRAKVSDFGLTKLVEVENASTGTGAVGTFGYIAPECFYGEMSAKADVYAFGVVLYQLISAKPAIIKLDGPETEFRGLVAVFNEAINKPDTKEALRKMVDPKLGDSYEFDSVYEMAELARSCTQEKPQQRPLMKHVVFALMTLSSTTGSCDVGYLQDEDLVKWTGPTWSCSKGLSSDSG